MKKIFFASVLVFSLKSYAQAPVSFSKPVLIAELKALKEKENIQVKWQVVNDTNVEEYLLQRSINGVQFSTISMIKGLKSITPFSYSFSDNSAVKGINYYRLAIVEKGKTEYTKVVVIKNVVDKNSFMVSTQGQLLNLNFSGIEAGTYRLSVMNTSGQLLQSLSLLHDGSDVIKQIDMKGHMTNGVYRVTLQSDYTQFIKSILVQ